MENSYTSFEPVLSYESVKAHYEGIYKTMRGKYTLNLKSCGINTPEYPPRFYKKTDRELKRDLYYYGFAVYAHEMFFNSLTEFSSGYTCPKERFGSKIRENWSSYDSFLYDFTETALKMRGPGFVWAALDCSGGRLLILSNSGYEAFDIKRYIPLFCIDMFEHSYYIDYYFDREKYLKNCLRIINYARAEKLLENIS